MRIPPCVIALPPSTRSARAARSDRNGRAVDAAEYPVGPGRQIGQERARGRRRRLTTRELQIFPDGQLVKIHVRAAGRGKITDWADYPPEKIAFHMRTPTWCRTRAAELGAAASVVIAEACWK